MTKEWTIESSVTTARTVAAKVKSEHDHGLLARERRQPRTPGILSGGGASETKGILESPSRRPAADVHPLEAECLGDGILSPFRRSSVSECLFTSNLAEVKLLLFSSWLLGGPSAEKASVNSSSSEEDLLRIELGDKLHPERDDGLKVSPEGIGKIFDQSLRGTGELKVKTKGLAGGGNRPSG